MVIDGPVDVVEFRLLVRGTVTGCGLGRVSPPAPTYGIRPSFFTSNVDHVTGRKSFVAAVCRPGRADACHL